MHPLTIQRCRYLVPLSRSGHHAGAHIAASMGNKLSAAGLGNDDSSRRKAERSQLKKKDLKKEQEQKAKERKERLKALEDARAGHGKRTSRGAAELDALKKQQSVRTEPGAAWPEPK